MKRAHRRREFWMEGEQYREDREARYRPERHTSLTREDDASGREWEESFLWSNPFSPPEQLRHEGMSLESVVKMLRMRHVLSFLLREQVELLMEHFVERLTYEEMANKRETTRQAVFQRTETARRDLLRAMGEHWNDPLDLNELPVGHDDDASLAREGLRRA